MATVKQVHQNDDAERIRAAEAMGALREVVQSTKRGIDLALDQLQQIGTAAEVQAARNDARFQAIDVAVEGVRREVDDRFARMNDAVRALANVVAPVIEQHTGERAVYGFADRWAKRAKDYTWPVTALVLCASWALTQCSGVFDPGYDDDHVPDTSHVGVPGPVPSPHKQTPPVTPLDAQP